MLFFLRLMMLIFAVSLLPARIACCQNYPNKPIRIVTGGVGGSSDVAARLIVPGLTSSLRQSVIIDNRSAGVIPGQIVSQAPPDGYTLLLAGGTFSVGPFLQKTPYDPVQDFLPITLMNRSPLLLVVYPAIPVKSVQELIAYAKAQPGTLNYAATGTGGSSHLAAELFKSMAGVDIVRINYKGGGAAMVDLIAGQVQLTFATAAGVTAHVKAGRLRPLAVTSAQPSPLFPELPAVASGLPGYEAVTIFGMLAPAKTPVTIIDRLNREIVQVLDKSDVRAKFFDAGVETVGSSPEQYATALKLEIARMGKVIRATGIRAE